MYAETPHGSSTRTAGTSGNVVTITATQSTGVVLNTPVVYTTSIVVSDCGTYVWTF